MMIHVKRILLQWYVIKLLYNGASPRSGWKKIYLDIQNGFRLRNAQWLQGLPPFHLRQVLGFPSSDRCGLGVTSMSTAPVRKRGMRGEIKVLQTNFSFTWGNVAD